MSPSLPLPPEFRQALDQSAGGPLFFVDAGNGQELVILPAATYQALAQEFGIAETYAAQNSALAAIWDDPALDIYNDPPPPSDA